jgi:competence protein ComEC
MRDPGPVPKVLSAGSIVFLLFLFLTAGCTGLPALTTPSHQAANNGDLRVYFLDVGQGDSSLILFRDKVILIDAGEIDQGSRVVDDIRGLGIRRIDLLVATHPHSDHIGGMQAVLAAFPVGEVLDSGMPSTSALYGHFLETVDRKNIPYIVADGGRTVDLDPAMQILVLSPPKERIGEDLNTNSIMLRVSYGNISFLFTGDAGNAAESQVMKTGYSLQSTVLKVAHHGSSDASSREFIARVRPEVAVISVGKDNPYGHPHRETLDTLTALVPATYRTDRDGTILVRSDGISYSVATENGQGGITALPSPALSPAMTTGATSFTTIPGIPVPNVTLNLTLPAVTVPALPSSLFGNASFMKISAVRFDAPGDDRQNLNGEWVQLNNTGTGPVLMAGWTLSDRTGSDPYIFPAVVLMPGDYVTVYTGSGTMNDTALFMGRTEPLWGNSGDTAFLRDAGGNLADSRSGG